MRPQMNKKHAMWWSIALPRKWKSQESMLALELGPLLFSWKQHPHGDRDSHYASIMASESLQEDTQQTTDLPTLPSLPPPLFFRVITRLASTFSTSSFLLQLNFVHIKALWVAHGQATKMHPCSEQLKLDLVEGGLQWNETQKKKSPLLRRCWREGKGKKAAISNSFKVT